MNCLTMFPLLVSWAVTLLHFGTAFNGTGENEDNSSYALQKEFPVKCYEELGCFDTGPPFYDPPNRPVTFLPFDLDHIRTKFLLFTPINRMDGRVFNFTGEGLNCSDFDSNLDTKFIVPGFSTFLFKSSLIHVMKNAFLSSGDYNVVLVDWGSSNRPPYLQAAANARVVAAQIAYFIGILQSSMNVTPESIHLIGHSLGAHLVGLVGKRIKGLGRISGLDPAGPYFYKADSLTRLDADDADFVDVIYTNGGSNYTQGLGLNEPIGDVNFYPNGGARQPGCYMLSEENSKVDFDPYANGCSHQRALSFYISSIENTSCKFWAVQCPSFEHFTRRACERRSRMSTNLSRIQMGYYALKPSFTSRRQKYYLRTDAAVPYCCHKTNE